MSTDPITATQELPVDGSSVLIGYIHSAMPLPDVALTLTDQTGAQVARTHSDDNGQFRFSGIRAGAYVLVAAKDGYQPHAETMTLRSGQPQRVELALDPAGSVYGLVHDSRSGQPVPAAAVSAIGSDGEVVGSTISDPDGQYRITGIAAATVTLVVAAAATEPTATVLQLDAGDGVPNRALDLAVETFGVLTGTVTADGHAVAALELSLYDEQGTAVATTVTDHNGAYHFDRVPAGNYTVRSAAHPPQARPVSAEARQFDVSLAAAL